MGPFQPLRQRISNLSGRDCAVLFLIAVTLPLFIAGMQALLLLVIIPSGISPDLVWLAYDNPTISGMFFSSYFQSITDPAHLNWNYLSAFAVMAIIGVLYVVVMPAYGVRASRRFMALSLLSFFLLLPFWIAAFSLRFHPVFPGAVWAVGSSGIIAALLGFALLLMLRCAYAVRFANAGNPDRDYSLWFIFPVLLIALVPLWIMFAEAGGTVNVVAHMVGYSFGLLVPALLGLSEECMSRDRQSREKV